MSDKFDDRITEEHRLAMQAFEPSLWRTFTKALRLQFGALAVGIAIAIAVGVPVLVLKWISTLF